MTESTLNRTALIAYLAEHSPARWIGRTALMKYCYFLQVLREVPLGYSFSLYSYGPFDSAVLSDLGDAEALGVIVETPLPTGYGYKIRSVVSEDELSELASGFLAKHESEIDWVIQQFGSQSASDLELDSTIVYVDREASQAGIQLPESRLLHKVKEVKPHFAEDKIRTHLLDLKEKQLIHVSDAK